MTDETFGKYSRPAPQRTWDNKEPEKSTAVHRPKLKWAHEVLQEQANRPKAKVSPLLEDWLKEKGISLDSFKKTKKA